MKRAFPQKVRLGTCQISENGDLTGSPVTKVFANGNRRTRTSAAMVGLALSMGASSLLVPRHDDGAAAAEARTTESTVAQSPQSFHVAASSTGADVDFTVNAVEHVVQPGQTLWQISQQYGVPVEVITVANDLQDGEPIRVGQALKIPGAQQMPSVAVEQPSAQETLVASATPTASPAPLEQAIEADRVLQAEQQAALENLAQRRQQLENSLAALNSQSSSDPSANARKAADDTLQTRRQSIVATPTPEPTPLVQQPVVPDAVAPQVSDDETSAFADEAARVESSQEVATLSDVEPTLELENSTPAPESVAVNPAALEPEEVEPVTSLIYRVAPGDTVSSLARKYNVSVSQLVAENNISDPNYIYVGQAIQVPVSVVATADVAAPPTLVAQRLDSDLSLASAPDAAQSAEVSDVPSVPSVTVPQELSAVPQGLQDEQGLSESEIIPPVSGENPYVANLLEEIRVMSDRYRDTSSVEATTTVPSAALEEPSSEQLQISLAEPVTQIPEAVSVPSLLAVGSSSTSRDTTQISVVTRSTESLSEADASPEAQEEQQLVAVAPLGSESYQPLLEPITGRMVSPDLPPLPAADEFLPESAASFDGYIWPAQGMLSSGYGWRWGRMHHGIDIAAPIGTPIYSAAPGVVEYAGWNSGGYGNMIEVRHADGSMTRYAHLDSISVKSGQEVKQGEQIGEMGSTGYSTGPHLHFEIHLAQGTVNPIAYLP